MVKLGIDNIESYLEYFNGKNVGLITNPTGINSKLESTIDLLKKFTNLVALFSPEHGVRGNIQAGEKLDTYIDEKSQVVVHSLYGTTKRPTKEMLENIDILCYDIQDVGSRFYTYIYTMAYAMEACKQYNIPFVVFDRPNPINGLKVEGNILDLKYRSFIGYYPITQRYGLTIGECAVMFNEEYGINCDLLVVPMEGWKREMMWNDTGLHWVFPSPNIPTVDSALAFNATCVFEGTNISEGRGTTKPFELVGAPWIDPDILSERLNNHELKGVRFRPLYFTPTFSKHANVMCGGVELIIIDQDKFNTVKTGWTMLYEIKDLSQDKFSYRAPYVAGGHPMIDLNNGNSYLREKRFTLEKLYYILEKESVEFKNIKEKYHLYK